MCGVLEALTLLGSVVGAIGQYEAGKAQAAAIEARAQEHARMMEMQARVNEQNALFADRRARDAMLRGAEESERVRNEGKQLMGRQIAQLAASNLDLGFGSPLDVLVDTAVGTALDDARARRNAALEAEDFDMQAWNYRTQAMLDRENAAGTLRVARIESRAARQAGVIGAVGSLIGGIGTAYRYSAKIA
jgi:hypothetical protein